MPQLVFDEQMLQKIGFQSTGHEPKSLLISPGKGNGFELSQLMVKSKQEQRMQNLIGDSKMTAKEILGDKCCKMEVKG